MAPTFYWDNWWMVMPRINDLNLELWNCFKLGIFSYLYNIAWWHSMSYLVICWTNIWKLDGCQYCPFFSTDVDDTSRVLPRARHSLFSHFITGILNQSHKEYPHFTDEQTTVDGWCEAKIRFMYKTMSQIPVPR